MTPFLGIRGSEDFISGADPQNYRQGILQLNPNGSTVLTALMSMAQTQSINSTKHHWFTRTFSSQGGTVASIYINETLTTAYVYATHQAAYGINGGVVYAKVSEAVAGEFVEGKQVLLVDTNRSDVDLNGYVIGVGGTGSSSWIAIKLKEADDNSAVAATYNLATVDAVYVVASNHPQGGNRPDSITWDPTELTNVTDITRTAIELSRTAAKMNLRTGNPLNDARDQALLYHGYELEKKLLFSIYDASSKGANGKPLYSAMGLRQFMRTYAAANVDDFTLNTAYTGKTWEQSGVDYIDSLVFSVMANTVDQPGSWGGETRLALCGPGAMQGIHKVVRATSTYNITKGETGFGMAVKEWETPAGGLYLKLYPMFQKMPRFSNTMIIVEPRNMHYIPFADDDTHMVSTADLLKKGLPVATTGKDGIDEEWLTENTFEFDFPETMFWAEGIGLNNNLS